MTRFSSYVTAGYSISLKDLRTLDLIFLADENETDGGRNDNDNSAQS
jgi:hypothetical protein